MTNTIIKAMNNMDFLDFVQSCDASGRLQKACEEFFTDYHGQDPETQLNKIPRNHLVALWRFFVAYILGLKPYGFQMDVVFTQECRTPWNIHALKDLTIQQYKQNVSKLA